MKRAPRHGGGMGISKPGPCQAISHLENPGLSLSILYNPCTTRNTPTVTIQINRVTEGLLCSEWLCTPPKFMYWNLNAQGEGTGRRGLWRGLAPEGGALTNGIRAFVKEAQGASCSHHMRTRQEISQPEEALTGPGLLPGSGTSSLQNREK